MASIAPEQGHWNLLSGRDVLGAGRVFLDPYTACHHVGGAQSLDVCFSLSGRHTHLAACPSLLPGASEPLVTWTLGLLTPSAWAQRPPSCPLNQPGQGTLPSLYLHYSSLESAYPEPLQGSLLQCDGPLRPPQPPFSRAGQTPGRSTLCLPSGSHTRSLQWDLHQGLEPGPISLLLELSCPCDCCDPRDAEEVALCPLVSVHGLTEPSPLGAQPQCPREPHAKADAPAH